LLLKFIDHCAFVFDLIELNSTLWRLAKLESTSTVPAGNAIIEREWKAKARVGTGMQISNECRRSAGGGTPGTRTTCTRHLREGECRAARGMLLLSLHFSDKATIFYTIAARARNPFCQIQRLDPLSDALFLLDTSCDDATSYEPEIKKNVSHHYAVISLHFSCHVHMHIRSSVLMAE
jgi:hypothetical protein